ncbi:hypothetical protein [Amycolatopsis saalfeldensis]|uniref:Uncharacterized protein n=1 Tax=Amycolatopsis saalfeldensis TaxID=394193 RepID=A0A1H8YNN8_9PSEU|nr:hypothetical protein [Amycolatopsis saalfeldensis]SEP53790.1 hypothetical protein SAMN04489732_13129 [Amycolatopsis saalfeldensis]
MNRIRRPVVGLMITAAALAGCSNTPVPSAAPPSPSVVSSSWIPAPEQTIAENALQVYRQYWQLSEEAEASPGSQDWRTSFAHLMADPALTTFVDELAKLASIPAHSTGGYRRSPKVQSVATAEPARVVIVDYLDASANHLVSERLGEAGKNLDNPAQPHRYLLEAEVVRYPAPYRWLVQIIRLCWEQTC